METILKNKQHQEESKVRLDKRSNWLTMWSQQRPHYMLRGSSGARMIPHSRPTLRQGADLYTSSLTSLGCNLTPEEGT